MKYIRVLLLIIFCCGMQTAVAQLKKEIDYALYMDDTMLLKQHINQQNINQCQKMHSVQYSFLDLTIVYDAKKCFDWMLRNGADVNSYCGEYKTPVGHAVKYGRLDMLKAIISKGGDPGFTYRGENMIEYAESKEKMAIAEYLKSLTGTVAAQPKKVHYIIQIEKERQLGENGILGVRFWPDLVNWRTWPIAQKVPEKNKQFYIELPAVDRMGWVFVGDYAEILKTVMVEPGDSVCIKIHYDASGNEQFTFLGRGAEKYQYLQDIKWGNSWQYWSSLKTGQSLSSLRAAWDSILNSNLQLLSQYKSISAPARHLLEMETRGMLYREFTLQLYYKYKDATEADKPAIREAAGRLPEPVAQNDPALLLSKTYIEYLYEKMKLHLLFRFGFGNNDVTGISFIEMYKAVKATYTAVAQEKLMAFTLVEPFDIMLYYKPVDAAEYTWCLQDGYDFLKIPFLKQAVQKRMQAFSKGSKVYDFTFADTAGRAVKLRDFKGKVVLIDVWGEGCGACLLFKQKFEKSVYPRLKNDTDFVVLSISVDLKKERWIQGLDKFSRPEYVNAGMPGIGLNHPFTQYYNVMGIPFLMLVDRNGRLVSATVSAFEENEKLVQQFTQAVQQPYKPE